MHDDENRGGATGAMTGARWTIVALLFFATTVNYLDRAVLGVLKPLLAKDLAWTDKEYGWIVAMFQFAYAAGYVGAGRMLDRVGVRLGFMLAVGLWSLAACGHAFVRTVAGFGVARAALGLAEGGGFPAAIKTVSEWFPREQRAFATGLFNAGSNVGAVLCPLAVPWIATHWGWPAAFLATGLSGFIWLAFWAALYRAPEEHRGVNAAELAFIRKDPPEPAVPVSWLRLLAHRQTWAFIVGMMASSPIWWFYIFWVPGFLNERYHLSLTQSSLPLMAIFILSSFGGIGGGWLSSTLLRRGWSVNAARKTALLACAVCVVPVFATPLVDSVTVSVGLIALAAAAHCGFAANLFTLVSDTVPRHAISSVVGLGGMAGSLVGAFFSPFVGWVLDVTHKNYLAPFAIAALAYLVAVAIMHALLPRWERMRAG